MTAQEAADVLISRYGAVVDRQTIRKRTETGTAAGLTVRTCYNVLKLVLSIQTGQPEIFTRSERRDITAAADNLPEVFAALTAPTRAKTGTVYYFPK